MWLLPRLAIPTSILVDNAASGGSSCPQHPDREEIWLKKLYRFPVCVVSKGDMPVSVLVRGEIEYGRLHEYLRAVKAYKEYRRKRGYVVPKVFLGLSGPMNTVLMTYQYENAAAYEEEEATSTQDKEYAEVASRMPYREGTISYELFKEM